MRMSWIKTDLSGFSVMDHNPFVIARRKVKDFDTVFALSPPNYEYTITWYIEWIYHLYQVTSPLYWYTNVINTST